MKDFWGVVVDEMWQGVDAIDGKAYTVGTKVHQQAKENAMDRTALKMKKTMEEMLRNCGYVATIGITKEGYSAKLGVSMSGEMTLKYPVTLTPGEVVWEVKSIFDRLNHTNTVAAGK